MGSIEPGTRRAAARRGLRCGGLALILGLVLATPAAAEDYDPMKAGHPLRIVAYAVHPAGVILDYLIFRPAWWIGGHEPIRTLVGREPAPMEWERPATEPEPAEPEPGTP